MEPPELEASLPVLLRRVVRDMPLDAHLEDRMRDILPKARKAAVP